MGSVGELILEGHFSRLRDNVNKMTKMTNVDAPEREEFTEVVHQTLQYLKKLKQKDLLDSEGINFINKLSDLLDRQVRHNSVPDKMPMEKARRKAGDVNKRNTA
ncbi:MAG: hypothetical protein WD555_00485 [Fulvivirga sp.]